MLIMFNTILILYQRAYFNQYAEISYLSRIILTLDIFLIILLLNYKKL